VISSSVCCKLYTLTQQRALTLVFFAIILQFYNQSISRGSKNGEFRLWFLTEAYTLGISFDLQDNRSIKRLKRINKSNRFWSNTNKNEIETESKNESDKDQSLKREPITKTTTMLWHPKHNKSRPTRTYNVATPQRKKMTMATKMQRWHQNKKKKNLRSKKGKTRTKGKDKQETRRKINANEDKKEPQQRL